ncbi:hypothetical protein CJF30_00007884 [Rutstroemia sp. NJR-2017a BBW]|nr:hypothetical protein CJF30_00007884 [Rutstroemia sp. NJR-2017a BBW]
MARQSDNSKNAVFGHRANGKENDGTPAKVSAARPNTPRTPPSNQTILKIAKNIPLPKRPTKTVLVKPIIKSSTKDTRHGSKSLKSSRKSKSKHVRVREPSHDSEDLEKALESNNVCHLPCDGEEGFEKVHQKLVKKIDAGIEKNKEFFKKVSNAVEILDAPMADEKIETTVLKNGKRTVQVVEIGKRIVDFKKNIEKEEDKLADYWNQYEQLQLEFEEFGVQVFGARALKVDEDKYDEEGYRHEVDLLETEYHTQMEGIMEELRDIGEEAIKKMRASEKEIDAVAGKERSRLLLAFME